MPAHLMAETAVLSETRPRLAGANYRGLHRAPVQQLLQAGSLVLEPGSRSFSSVIRLIDGQTALVRSVGSFDDHPIALSALRTAGAEIRIGADFGDRD